MAVSSVEAEPLVLDLKSPFRIAHGASTSRTNVLVRFGNGVGEGALPPYYPYRLDDVLEYLQHLIFDPIEDPFALEIMLRTLPPGPAPAMAAIDIALHDHWARLLGLPLYRLWGLSPQTVPYSSLTLSIPNDETHMRQQVRDALKYPILKLKLGTGNLDQDEAIVRIASEESGASLCVDVNSGWTVDQAAEMIPRLSSYGLAFIEQPIPADDPVDWRRLRSRLPSDVPPLIADESVQGSGDVLALHDSIDGINIKLTKAGGLQPAFRMIGLARILKLKVMLGCMIESSVGLTAAAHLAPLVDYADLDGYLYLANDPFSGMIMTDGRIHIPEGPGLGVTPKSDIRHQ